MRLQSFVRFMSAMQPENRKKKSLTICAVEISKPLWAKTLVTAVSVHFCRTNVISAFTCTKEKKHPEACPAFWMMICSTVYRIACKRINTHLRVPKGRENTCLQQNYFADIAKI